jgi:recombination protein RecA
VNERLAKLVRLRDAPVRRGGLAFREPTVWGLAGLQGRLAELSGANDSAALTAAFGLVREAQARGEPAAWVTPLDQAFFPPDAAAGGIDLDALAVVRTSDAGRAAAHLVRSGAFALVVIDLAESGLDAAAQSRLLGLARRHETAVLCLTRKEARAPSLGSLVSLRGHATRARAGPDRFICEVRVLKDKRRAPGWSVREVCRGPDGLH